MRSAHDDNVTWGNRFKVYERCARREQVKSTEVNAEVRTAFIIQRNKYVQASTTAWTGPRERLQVQNPQALEESFRKAY